MKKRPTFMLHVLIYPERDLLVAHCLELDIVAAGKTEGEVMDDIKDLCIAQIKYAIENDNMEYLFKPVPSKIWNKWLKSKKAELTRPSEIPTIRKGIIPPRMFLQSCYAS